MSLRKQYWLMKSEPSDFSIDDLKSCKSTCWSGVRNYQARNYMRDEMKIGDRAFFYQSNAKQIGIVGTAKVIKEGYADYTAWDPKDKHYDPKSSPEKPVWFMVDIEIIKTCRKIITLNRLKSITELNHMGVVQRGNRLSVQQVSPEAWETILKLPEWN